MIFIYFIQIFVENFLKTRLAVIFSLNLTLKQIMHLQKITKVWTSLTENIFSPRGC